MPRALVPAFLLCLLPWSLWADPVRDAAFDPRPANLNGLGTDAFLAQSFVVGQSGILTGVQLLVFQPSPADGGRAPASLRLWVLPMAGAEPVNNFGDALATGTITSADVPLIDVFGSGPFTSVPLSNPFRVTAGDRLALAVYPDQDFVFYWGFQPDNPYPFGNLHARCAPATNEACRWFSVLSEEFDMGFATFLEPAAGPVPEPATWLLFGAGAAAAGRRTWRRRQRIAAQRL